MVESGDLYFWDYINTIDIVWGVTFGLSALNKLVAFLLLFSSMEIFLFNKKSKWKFGILAIVLLGGIFIMTIVNIVLYYTINYEGYNIARGVVAVLTNFNYWIIGIVILILLAKTSKENAMLRNYTRLISIGIVLMLIIYPLILIWDNQKKKWDLQIA